jgi:hypothetical protein
MIPSIQSAGRVPTIRSAGPRSDLVDVDSLDFGRCERGNDRASCAPPGFLFLFLEDLIGNMRREEQSETNLIENLSTKNNL